MSDNYKQARPWHRFRRMLERTSPSLRPYTVQEVEQFYREVDGHLTGSFIKSEVQAGGLRIFVLYREIEQRLNRSHTVDSFARALGERPPQVYNWLRGSTGIKRYTIDILQSWCSLLTKYWEDEGVILYILCHPTGIIEPLIYVKPEE